VKLCVFDCDSTLIDAETIDELARLNGQNAAVSAITERAMAGKLDFFEALSERVKLLRGVDYQTACEVCHSLPLMPGAEEVVAELKARAYRVIIFSGGFREATVPLAQKLGADADFANFLHHKEGLLTGLVGGEMMAAGAKGTMLERLQRLLGVSAKDTVSVGDGANDLAMFARSETRIAFCAKPILREAATACVDDKDLRGVLEHLP
jgi:phosphoserine phosphatase